MRLLSLLVLFLSCVTAVKSTHIVGGEVYYDCLGGDNYRITVKVYRDCSDPGNAAFDNPLPLTIYDGSNNLVGVFNIALPPPYSIPTTSTNPCLIPPTQCIEVATYDTILNLPPVPGGYTIVYQRCCRNATILNIQNPNSTGGTYFIQIPDASTTGVSCNSSPRFSALPPLVICANDNFVFNHAATDPDGDSLVYSFYTPYEGGSTTGPSPIPSAPPPYIPVTWVTGFSTTNQINGTPNLTIDPVTGVLTCMPSVIGIYVYAVKVQEYRGGILLSESMREFQVNIVPCTVSIDAIIQPQTAVQLCSGLTLSFTNNSVNATNYLWDFGDTTTTTDVSTLVNPSYTYPDTGVYYVTLIANPGTVCCDTTVVPFYVHLPLSVTYARPPAQCVNTNSFELLATGNFTGNAMVTWTLPSSNTPLQYTNPATNIIYPDSGRYLATVGVTEFGCTEIYTDTLFVYPLPVIGFTYPQELRCEPYTITFTDTSLSWSPIYYTWTFGTGDTSHVQSPTYTYDDTGYYDISLTISVDTICVVEQTIFIPDAIHVVGSPDANLYVTPRIQSIYTPYITVADLAQNITNQYIYYGDGDTTWAHNETHQYADTGWYYVTQWVINSNGCIDTAVVPVYILPETDIYIPNAFTPNGDGQNDIFLPVVRDVRRYQFFIFNRWGQVIWQTDNPLAGWDGRLNNKIAREDVYVYKVKYMDQRYSEHEKRGHFSLLR